MRDDERFTPADQLPAGLIERANALADAAEDVEGCTVPWVAGRSRDGKKFYPDADLPLEVGDAKIRTRRTVKLHEFAELICMDAGETYDKDSDPPGQAHYHANGVEKLEVEAQGGDWGSYCLALRPILKNVDDEELTNLPPADEWDRRPYEDDDPILLREIDAADKMQKSTFSAPGSATSGLQGYGLEDSKSKSSKKTAKYTPGPVDQEPCRDCTMFSPPSACTAVRGKISPDGHCKFFKAKAAKAKESDMDELKLFIPLTKVDAAQRLIYGVATAEKPDVAKEICDYATTKPLYERWSEQFAKATDGKSLGNLRVMHGPVAAGKLTNIAFNDDAKQIEICAKVVDDAEWQKVEEGVYTGFSQGGKYIKRWKDGDFTRYTAEPIEVSLVDNPCLPEATFQVIKVDGTEEMRKFKSVEDEDATKARPNADTPNDNAVGKQVWINERLPGKFFGKKSELQQALIDLDAEEAARKTAAPVLDAIAEIKQTLDKRDVGDKTVETKNIETAVVEKKDYSDDERSKMADSGEAMKDGSFPIKNRKDLENAVQAFGRAKNKAAAKRHIIKRAKALKATDLLPADWSGSTKKDDTEKVAKAASLWSVSDLLLLLSSIEYAEENAESPSWGFGSSVELSKELTDRFGAALVELGDIAAEMLDAVLSAIKDEEASEAVATAARAMGLAKLAKIGAKHSKADKQLIKQAHDSLAELDPDSCPATNDGDAEKLAKRGEADRKAFAATLDSIMPVLKDIADRVKKIEAQPLPMGVSSVTVVDKGRDFNVLADQIADASDPAALRRLAEAAQLATQRLITQR